MNINKAINIARQGVYGGCVTNLSSEARDREKFIDEAG